MNTMNMINGTLIKNKFPETNMEERLLSTSKLGAKPMFLERQDIFLMKGGDDL